MGEGLLLGQVPSSAHAQAAGAELTSSASPPLSDSPGPAHPSLHQLFTSGESFKATETRRLGPTVRNIYITTQHPGARANKKVN